MDHETSVRRQELSDRAEGRRVRSRSACWSAMLALGIALTSAAPAAGTERDDAAQKRAEALLQRGAQSFAKGACQEALNDFVEAKRLFPSPEIDFDIGLAQGCLDNPVDALRAFDRYLRYAASSPADPDNLVQAKEQSASLLPKVAVVHVEGPPSGTELLLDGHPQGTTPLTLYALPGSHSLLGRHGGLQSAEKRFTAVAGHDLTLQLSLLPVAPPPPPSPLSPRPSPPPSPSPSHSYRMWLLVGAGVVTAAAVVFFAADRSTNDPIHRGAGTLPPPGAN